MHSQPGPTCRGCLVNRERQWVSQSREGPYTNDWRKSYKGQAALKIYANKTDHPSWFSRQHPNSLFSMILKNSRRFLASSSHIQHLVKSCHRSHHHQPQPHTASTSNRHINTANKDAFNTVLDMNCLFNIIFYLLLFFFKLLYFVFSKFSIRKVGSDWYC